jgi:hypothetical protein
MLATANRFDDIFWTAPTQRIALGLGLVLGIGLLGAVAFTARPDIRVVWFDERGRLAIGIRRTETEELLARAVRDFEQSTRSLDTERVRNDLLGQRLANEGRRRQEMEQRLLKAREIDQLGEHPRQALYEYRTARIDEQNFLPLRDRPEGASATLKAIPSRATRIFSSCKLVVHRDAVFIETSYDGTTGWVSGYYLTNTR